MIGTVSDRRCDGESCNALLIDHPADDVYVCPECWPWTTEEIFASPLGYETDLSGVVQARVEMTDEEYVSNSQAREIEDASRWKIIRSVIHRYRPKQFIW